MIARARLDVVLESKDDLEEIISNCVSAKNRLLSNSGFSPYQRALGYQPLIPGSLIADGDRDHNIAVSAKILGGDAALIRSMNIRTAAAKAFAETDAQERIRRAVLEGHRPIVNLQIGPKVFFWRRSGDLKATSADRAHTHWHGPATIINHHATKVWLSFRGAVVMCSPEQIRRASLEEELASDNIPEELRTLEKNFEDPDLRYLDLTSSENLDLPTRSA